MDEWKNTVSTFRPFFRGLPFIIALMVIAIAIVKKYVQYATPLYESVSEIKLADINEGISNANLYKDFDVFVNSNKISAEVELLKSNVVIEEAIDNLNLGITIFRTGEIHKNELYKDVPFILTAQLEDKKLFDQSFGLLVSNDSLVEITTPGGSVIKGKVGQFIPCSFGGLLLKKNDSLLAKKPWIPFNDSYEFTVHSKNWLVQNIKSKIDVMSLDKDVPILRIAYKCPVPEKAADIVNTISQAYINDYIHEKYKTADTTVEFLNKQLDTYKEKLSASETDIEQYRDANKIINIPQETETDLRKIADLKKQLSSVQMNLLAIDSLNQYLKNGKDNMLELAPNFEAFNDLLSTEIIKKIKTLQAEKKDLLLKYTPENDKVLVVDSKLNDLTNYLRESVKNTQANLQVKYNDLIKTIEESEKVFDGLPTKEKNMTVLDRRFNMNDQVYRFLHEKRTNAEIARAANISFHRIIARGEVPVLPVSPNAGLLKILAAFLAFLAGTFIVYFARFLKGKINNETTIYRNSDTPLFASVPFIRKRDQYNTIFEKLTIQMSLKNWLDKDAVLCFSSYDNGEGKEFISNAFAEQIRAIGKKTIVVNADEFNKENSSIVHLSEVVPAWKNADVLQQQLTAWKQEYDIIIIKNAPISRQPSSLTIMSIASVNFLVVDSTKTNKKRIAEADLLKNELNIKNMFFILNRAGYSPTTLTIAVKFFKHLFKKSNNRLRKNELSYS